MRGLQPTGRPPLCLGRKLRCHQEPQVFHALPVLQSNCSNSMRFCLYVPMLKDRFWVSRLDVRIPFKNDRHAHIHHTFNRTRLFVCNQFWHDYAEQNYDGAGLWRHAQLLRQINTIQQL